MTMNIYEGKTLKLNNVLSTHITMDELINRTVDKRVKLFNSYILNNNGKLKGPLVSRNKILKNNMQKVSFFQQVQTPLDAHPPYEFDEQIIVENCLFTRFEGKAYDADFAYHKIQVYAYEKGINLFGESYSVFLEEEQNKDNNVIIDIFFPVK